MTNENNLPQNVDMTTGEVLNTEMVVADTPEYTVVKLADGTFKKNMKYKKFHSFVPETEEDMIELYKVFNDENNEMVTPLKNMINKDITIKNVFTNPYQSFDEKTGQVSHGVTVTIEDVDGSYYATSSKTVYHKVHELMESFGHPNTPAYRPIVVKVTGSKQKNGVQIGFSLVGLAK